MTMTEKKLKLQKKQLTQEIQERILSKLPAKDLVRFSCVSRRWCSVLCEPQFAKSLYKFGSEHQTLCPRFLICSPSELRSIDLETASSSVSVEENSSLTRNLQLPLEQHPKRTAQVVGSCNGLVCLSLVFLENFYIWNPTTGYLLKLADPPKDIKNNVSRNCGFGYVPATDDYKVVIVGANSYREAERGYLEVFSLRANSWKRIESPVSFKLRYDRGVLSNEALHWFYDENKVIAFDLAKEEFRDEVVLPIFEDEDEEIFDEEKKYLQSLGVLLDGRLCAWGYRPPHEKCIDIWVLREYGVHESWTMLFTFNVVDSSESCVGTPIFFRETGIVVINYWGTKEMELRWLDKSKDELDKTLVCSSRRYMIEGIDIQDTGAIYVETLLPFLPNPDEQPPSADLFTPQQITVQNIRRMVQIKLTSTNFTHWKSLFLQVLKRYRVEGLVDGTECCPPAFLFDDNGKIRNDVNPAFEKWMDLDQTVKVWLKSRISEDILPYTVGASSSRALWVILEERLADPSRSDFKFGH